MKNRRLLLAVAMLAAVAAIVGGCFYVFLGGDGGWVPGFYRAPSFDGKGTIVLQLAPDGSAVWEDFPAGAGEARSRKKGRWRLTGSVLVYEEGAAVVVPIGIIQRFAERRKTPLLTQDSLTCRLISADSSGLVVDLGGMQWNLQRVASPPAAP